MSARGTERSLQPQPGLYRVRMWRGAAFVAARLRYEPLADPETGEPLDRSWYWFADISGQVDENAAPVPSENVMQVWLFGEAINQAEYDFLVKDAEWARRYAPDDPIANPRQTVDVRKLPPIF